MVLQAFRGVLLLLLWADVLGASGWLESAERAIDRAELLPMGEALRSELERIAVGADNIDRLPDDFVTRVARMRFCEYFGRVTAPDTRQKRTLKLLARDADLLREVCLNVSRADSPDRVLQVLADLYEAEGESLRAAASLAAATCLVWDERAGQDPDAELAPSMRAIRAFRRSRQALRELDAGQTPVPILTWLVESTVSDEEWRDAVARYQQRRLDGSAVSDVPFNLNPGFSEDPAHRGARAYTLMNLRRLGGSPADQAYYAEQVLRANGVPAARLASMNPAGEMSSEETWCAFLERGPSAWNWNTGRMRFGEWETISGFAVDPQTRVAVSEAELRQSAALMAVGEKSYRMGRALSALGGDADEESAERLYRWTVELSPGETAAWKQLASRTRTLQPRAELSVWLQKRLLGELGADNPEFAVEIYLEVISERGTREQLELLSEMHLRVQHSVRASAMLAFRRIDLLVELGEEQAAWNELFRLATVSRRVTPITNRALGRMRTMLEDRGSLLPLVAVYEAVDRQASAPRAVPEGLVLPYGRFCRDYLALLEETGRMSQAQRVRSRLPTLTGTGRRR
jgi:hypothetical protein